MKGGKRNSFSEDLFQKIESVFIGGNSDCLFPPFLFNHTEMMNGAAPLGPPRSGLGSVRRPDNPLTSAGSWRCSRRLSSQGPAIRLPPPTQTLPHATLFSKSSFLIFFHATISDPATKHHFLE